jgi:general secretion pathway protein D
MTIGMTGRMSKGVAALLLGGCLGSGAGWAQSVNSGGAASQSQGLPAKHIINLSDVDISDLIDDVAEITGYTFVVHPSVRGKVTVSSQTPMTTREVFQVFLSTLRVHGFTAVPGANGVYKIVPEQAASAEAGMARSSVSGDQIETAVFHLDNIDTVEAAQMIKPVVNTQGQVTTSARSNAIIVVDYASNISRVREIIGRIDIDRSSVVTISLANSAAVDMAGTINELIANASRNFNFDVRAVPVAVNNSVLLRGKAEDVERVAQIVERLDADSRITNETLKVIPLKYAQATDLAPILQSVGGRIAEAASPASGGVPAPTVVVHEPTNSLVINAEPQILRQFERVVGDLDVRRSQVLVEAIVVELSDTATRELGLQFVLGGSEGNNVPFAVTNFSGSTPNVLAIAGALVGNNTLNTGEAGSTALQDLAVNSLLGTNGGLFGFGGTTDSGGAFGAIVNAVDDDTNSSILSTPSILALDNETASFLSGQEIPITTGEVLGTSNTNPFRTVERQDVGVQLDVQPQIGDGDAIKLYIRQEVSSVFGPVTSATGDLITNKRELSTTILADDGDIIVLGGLIQEDESVSVSKLPFLGDIPLLGRAFSNERVSSTRTNLMVFLRPTVVRDNAGMRSATESKYNFMIDTQKSANPNNRSSLEDLVERLNGD